MIWHVEKIDLKNERIRGLGGEDRAKGVHAAMPMVLPPTFASRSFDRRRQTLMSVLA
jgi:hypothetical protein